MLVDRWVRFIAAASLPILGAIAWAMRTDPPPARSPLLIASSAPSTTAREPDADEVALAGEKALARRPVEVKAPPERAAATLPPATPGPPSSQSDDRRARSSHGTCGGLEARLISVGDDPEWTFASVAAGPGEPAKLSRVGDRIDGWRVAAIEWDRVWVQSGGPRCALKLHEGLRQEAESRSHRASEANLPPAWSVPETIAGAIEKRSETEYRIDRAAVPAILEQGGTLLSGLRLLPAKAAREEIAIQFESVPVDSLLERLGVQSGDVLLSLNGSPCTTPGAALETLYRSREYDRLVARLERDGESFEIEISLVVPRTL